MSCKKGLMPDRFLLKKCFSIPILETRNLPKKERGISSSESGHRNICLWIVTICNQYTGSTFSQWNHRPLKKLDRGCNSSTPRLKKKVFLYSLGRVGTSRPTWLILVLFMEVFPVMSQVLFTSSFLRQCVWILKTVALYSIAPVRFSQWVE